MWSQDPGEEVVWALWLPLRGDPGPGPSGKLGGDAPAQGWSTCPALHGAKDSLALVATLLPALPGPG